MTVLATIQRWIKYQNLDSNGNISNCQSDFVCSPMLPICFDRLYERYFPSTTGHTRPTYKLSEMNFYFRHSNAAGELLTLFSKNPLDRSVKECPYVSIEIFLTRYLQSLRKRYR